MAGPKHWVPSKIEYLVILHRMIKWKFRESVHLIVVFREEIGECHLEHVNDTFMGNRAIYDLTTQTLVLI